MRSILWLRRDLRVHDNPALLAAREGAEQLVPAFVFDDRLLHGRHGSGARTKFLLECLTDLDDSLRRRGSALVVRHGEPERVLPALAREVDAQRLHFSTDVSPFARARDGRVAEALGEVGVPVHTHPGLFALDDLETIATRAGSAYTVFTPFYRAWSAAPRRPLAKLPRALPPLPPGVERGRLPRLVELGLRSDLEDPLPGGERAGRKRMLRFLAEGVGDYDGARHIFGQEGTSRLSPYLHFGCLSPRELEERAGRGEGSIEFRRQVGWRDFYAHVLLHFPENARSEHQRRYRGRLRYSHASAAFAAWRDGRTGYPLVDAGMRQLAREGWLHNRARLLVGSFLTKDLGIDWRWGERWFMAQLLDGDQASNNGNWQWIASVGVDPQPVARRIFSPARQQARFDPDGIYIRRYVPELRNVPADHLAEPWKMPDELQREVGCVIGRDYPPPIVDHARARAETLERYAAAR